MDIFLKQFQDVHWEQIIFTSTRILLVLLLAWLGMVILRKMLSQVEKSLLKQSEIAGEPPSESEKRVETLIRLIRQAAFIVLWVTTILILLKEIGIDVGPILASAGIVGLAVGFGAQNLVRDVISGFFIILENQVRVGDVAIVNGTGGLVERVNFRTIILRDLGGIVHIFPNGTITTLSNLTNDWSAYVFNIGV
ncbi:MAG: mechanosensitive ion channel, partial [Desulfuromusa sp.]|nr:mechanosensitive ion channel [Desulfuromusa sp.]